MEIEMVLPSNEILIMLTTALGFLTAIIVLAQKIRNVKKLETALASKQTLIGHSLFKSLYHHRNIVLYKFNLNDINKTNIFKDILIHQIDIWGNELLSFARRIDKTCNPVCSSSKCLIQMTDLIEQNRRLLNDGVLRYSSFFNNDEYTEEEKDMLRYAIDKFNIYHAHNMEYIIKTIEAITTNSKYTECAKTLQSYVFTAYECAMNNMIHEAENSLQVINGYFTGKEFIARKYSKYPEWFIRGN
jgi:hypothetical protein